MPHWAYTLDVSDVFHSKDLSFEQIRDAIVKHIQGNYWYARHGGVDTDLGDLVEELAEVSSAPEFDDVWNEIYNQADRDRCWIVTR